LICRCRVGVAPRLLSRIKMQIHRRCSHSISKSRRRLSRTLRERYVILTKRLTREAAKSTRGISVTTFTYLQQEERIIETEIRCFASRVELFRPLETRGEAFPITRAAIARAEVAGVGSNAKTNAALAAPNIARICLDTRVRLSATRLAAREGA